MLLLWTNRTHLIKAFICLALIVLALVCYFVPVLHNKVGRIAERMDLVRENWPSKPLGYVPAGYKTILVYTSFFGQVPWPIIHGKETHFTGLNGAKCKVSSCIINYHKQDYSRMDAVVFHSSNMPALSRMHYLLWNKPKRQKWVWFSLENPVKTRTYSYAIESIANMFELTMSYRTESNIFHPYGYYTSTSESDRAKTRADIHQQIERIIAVKDRLILWQVSNCDAGLRIKVAQAIDRYVHVDVFGDCQKYLNHTGSCDRWTMTCNTMSQRYKFYLAFENYNCIDYVTEKYWTNALARNIVPLVIGGTYNKNILIPGSYIDILDFPSAKSLAEYLMYLDSNSTAYGEYFLWKMNYTFYTGSTNWLCDLCEQLHTNMSGLPVDLSKFWGEGTCHADDWYTENVWLKSTSRTVSERDWGLPACLFVVLIGLLLS